MQLVVIALLQVQGSDGVEGFVEVVIKSRGRYILLHFELLQLLESLVLSEKSRVG